MDEKDFRETLNAKLKLIESRMEAVGLDPKHEPHMTPLFLRILLRLSDADMEEMIIDLAESLARLAARKANEYAAQNRIGQFFEGDDGDDDFCSQ